MRVLIIGGTGFIGPYVVTDLAAAGHEVTIFHRGEHEPLLPSSVRHFHGPDARYPVIKFPAELVSWQPEVVLHMVAMGEQDADAAVRTFRGVARRLVVLSSGDVYAAYGVLIGTQDAIVAPGLLKEDSPLRDNLYPYRKTARGPDDWIYHYEKILVERVVISASDPAPTILRMPAVFGPGDKRHGFFPYLKRMDDRRPAILLDEHLAHWRWTHGYVKDVAAAITLAVLDDRAANRIFNVGEQRTPTTEERLRLLSSLTGWKGEIIRLPRATLPVHLRDGYNYSCDLAYDTSRIRQDLGYKEIISAEESLRETIADLRAHPPLVDNAQFDYSSEDLALIAARRARFSQHPSAAC